MPSPARDARRRRAGRGAPRPPRARPPGWRHRSAGRRPSIVRPARRTSWLSTRCCHSSTSRNTLPSVWRASTSTASPSSGPTSWPVGRGDEFADAADVEAGHRHAGDPGQAAQVGQHGAQRLAGVGGRGAVGHDDEHVRQGLVVDELAEQVDRRPARPVEVVEHEQQRLLPGQLGDGADDGAEQARPLGCRDHRGRPARGSPSSAACGAPGGRARWPRSRSGRPPSPDRRRRARDRVPRRTAGTGSVCCSRARPEQHRPAPVWTWRANSVSSRRLAGAGLAGTSTTCRAPVVAAAHARPTPPRLAAPDQRERADERQERRERDRRRRSRRQDGPTSRIVRQ